jgi:regulator of sirC expression with transglutaminase-like and TPR domain
MNLDHALTLLARQPDAPLDLAELTLSLAADEYPALDVEAYLAELDGMAHEAKRYLGGSLESRVRGLCRYLFHEMGFRGNMQEYYDPRNSYLNEVLDRRTGIPITLSAVAMSVARRAGLEVVGVGLPGHFVAKAVAVGEEVIFDPFHGGRLLGADACEQLVRKVTGIEFQATPLTLRATDLGLMVYRMLSNLKAVYVSGGDFTRASRVMERLLQLCPGDLQQLRDLGAALAQSGQHGRAIDPLSAYLLASPQASDAEVVRDMLNRSKRAVAIWN